ncbi:MAG: protoporphyrinogen oxidase [Actinomycetes bacterium]
MHRTAALGKAAAGGALMTGVVVIGGGITGMAAAYDLAKAGIAVTLVEGSDRLGGKIRTDEVDGFLVEAGPDSFVAYRPAALQLASELGLGDDVISTTEPRLVYLRSNGRMIAMPDGMGLVLPTKIAPFARTELFTWPQKLRAGMDVVLPRSLGPEDISIGQFLRHRLGPAMVEQLGDPMLGGVYGASVDELSLDAVLPQFRTYEQDYRSLLLASLAQGRATRASAKKAAAAAGPGAAKAPDSPFRSLRRGMGSLVAALTERIAASPGVDLRYNTSVSALEWSDGRSTVRLSDGTVLNPDVVVIATPASATADLLADHVPTASEAIRGVPHGSTAVVSLGYDQDSFVSPLVGHGFLEAGPRKASFSGCTFTSLKWAGRAPAGKVLLRAFVPDRSVDLIARPDDEVFDVVHADLVSAIGVRKAPTMRYLARWNNTMPKYTVGHLARVAQVETAMAARPQWLLAGSTYRGVGVPECVASGRRAASAAMDQMSHASQGEVQAVVEQPG